jgi:hypothetical protein
LSGVLFQLGGDLATQMPPVFFRLDRCKRRDVKAFVHLFDTLFPEDGSGVGEKPSHSAVLQRQIAYTDLWDDDADPAALHAFIEDAVATTAVSANFSDVAGSWPVGPTDPAAGQFADPPAIPILLMHGGYDASISLGVADDFAAAWPDADWVPVPYAAHVAFNSGSCPQSLVESFVADPGAALDTSCVAAMTPPSFAADPTRDLELWGVDDRWGDEGGCAHTRFPSAAFPSLIAAALCGSRTRRAPTSPAQPAPPRRSRSWSSPLVARLAPSWFG